MPGLRDSFVLSSSKWASVFMKKVCKLTNREGENAVKHVIAIIILLAMSAGSVSADTQGYVEFGNWKVLDSEPDPFDPGNYFATAFVDAMSNSEIHGYFLLKSQCSQDNADELYTVFGAGYTNFTNDWYLGEQNKALVQVVFEKGKPRTLSVWVPRGGNSWHPSSEDQRWLESGMQSSDRMYVRWDQYGDGYVTAEFDLDGGKEAIAEIKRRCASPPSEEGGSG